MAFDPTLPFALLHDEARSQFRLFHTLEGTITADRTADVPAAIDALHPSEGWLAGGLSYEAGHALEPRLKGLEQEPGQLWFGRFATMALLSPSEALTLLEAAPRATHIGQPGPLLSESHFTAMVTAARRLIADGDIYQANLTFPASVAVGGHPMALFARLWATSRAPLAGLVHRGTGRWWISLSPELFFRMDKGTAIARPMKGTAPRAADPAADAALARDLSTDPKNRAENLMITDLIRNDLSRVAIPGTVRVPAPFTVETHPTVHQMTSTVTAQLVAGTSAADLLRALYPCGSITGAPKVRAMQVIAALEPAARGIYCGSIGWIAPGGEQAAFSVAIRTLVMDRANEARIGLGAGIVADSDPESEWRECLLKARFLHARRPQTLIETMRRDRGDIPRLARHLDRLETSARFFDMPFDRAEALARIETLAAGSGPERLRLLLSDTGRIAVQTGPIPPLPATLMVALAPLPVAHDDWRLAHKSSERAFYDEARRQSGADEVLLALPDGRLTEGSFTTLFVERNGGLLTPPATLGLLPGVLRAELLASGIVREADLTAADLAAGFLLGNSLRGLMPARLAPDKAANGLAAGAASP